MTPPDQTIILLNAVFNFLNLALTAWILKNNGATTEAVRKNTRTTEETAGKVDEVKSQTDGKISSLIRMLKTATKDLAAANARTRVAKAPKKPRAKPRSAPTRRKK